MSRDSAVIGGIRLRFLRLIEQISGRRVNELKELQCRHPFPILKPRPQIEIVVEEDSVEDNAVISGVEMVFMRIPLRRADVNLHITDVQFSGNLHFGVQEIRSLAMIPRSGFQHPNGASVNRLKVGIEEALRMP